MTCVIPPAGDCGKKWGYRCPYKQIRDCFGDIQLLRCTGELSLLPCVQENGGGILKSLQVMGYADDIGDQGV